MRTFRYVVCDVFTDRPLTGNQLAVFTDATGLDDATMQALAREMSFSESTFVLRATTRQADARIRIFTPRREVPFAGHPTLGTAFVLGAPLQRDVVRVETGRGVVAVQLVHEGARPVFGWMAQPLPDVVGEPVDHEALFAALGVRGSELPVTGYDNGIRHLYVALPAPEDVAALAPDLGALARLGDFGVNVFAGQGRRWKTRMFAPGHGVAENPATGSAAGPLALHLARHGRIAFGDEIEIEQGAELGRPSRLHARAHGDAAGVTAIEVGGAAVVVARGQFVLP